jgi:hypothetical protein
MAVILIRRRNYYEAGELDPETGHLRLIAREFREPPGGEGYWDPVIQEEGWFQLLGGVVVSVYREKREAPVLWLQLGAERAGVAERRGGLRPPVLRPPGARRWQLGPGAQTAHPLKRLPAKQLP